MRVPVFELLFATPLPICISSSSFEFPHYLVRCFFSLFSVLAAYDIHIPWAKASSTEKFELQDPTRNFSKLTSYVLVTGFFLSSVLFDLLKTNFHLLVGCSAYRQRILVFLYHSLHALLISNFLGYLLVNSHIRGLLLLAGDIESNPAPPFNTCLKFFHWNLNSICARDGIKIPLIEVYISVHRFDVMALSETMLDKSINNEDIYVQGFSREICRSDHASNTKTGE